MAEDAREQIARTLYEAAVRADRARFLALTEHVVGERLTGWQQDAVLTIYDETTRTETA